MTDGAQPGEEGESHFAKILSTCAWLLGEGVLLPAVAASWAMPGPIVRNAARNGRMARIKWTSLGSSRVTNLEKGTETSARYVSRGLERRDFGAIHRIGRQTSITTVRFCRFVAHGGAVVYPVALSRSAKGLGGMSWVSRN